MAYVDGVHKAILDRPDAYRCPDVPHIGGFVESDTRYRAHGVLVRRGPRYWIELLLIRLNKLPFTCSYAPGKANVKLLLPAYLIAMFATVSSVPRVEMALLSASVQWIAACGTLSASLEVLARWRRADAKLGRSFKYHEVVESPVQTLDIMRTAR